MINFLDDQFQIGIIQVGASSLQVSRCQAIKDFIGQNQQIKIASESQLVANVGPVVKM